MAVEMVEVKSRVNPNTVIAFPVDADVRFTDGEKEVLCLALEHLIAKHHVYACNAIMSTRGAPDTARYAIALSTCQKLDQLVYCAADSDAPAKTLDNVCKLWHLREAPKRDTEIVLASIGETRQAWIGYLIDHC
jgi:hypothetical protein